MQPWFAMRSKRVAICQFAAFPLLLNNFSVHFSLCSAYRAEIEAPERSFSNISDEMWRKSRYNYIRISIGASEFFFLGYVCLELARGAIFSPILWEQNCNILISNFSSLSSNHYYYLLLERWYLISCSFLVVFNHRFTIWFGNFI